MSDKNTVAEEGCPLCGQGPVTVIRRAATKRAATGAPIEMTEELSVCRGCGEEFFTPEQSIAQSTAYTNAVRAADGLMSREEIRATRLALNMSQAEFEEAMGVGKKTAVRWEKGTVPPGPTANAMLWVASRYPSIFLEYAKERRKLIGKPETAVGGPVIAFIGSAASGSAQPPVFKARKPKTIGVGSPLGASPQGKQQRTQKTKVMS